MEWLLLNILSSGDLRVRGKCPNMSTLRKTATNNFIILSGYFKLMSIISYAYSETETVFTLLFPFKNRNTKQK